MVRRAAGLTIRSSSQRLAEQEDLGGLDRQLAPPGLDHLALDADQVAGVQVGHRPELVLAERVDGEHDL
jgi:hypothetical protein